MWSRNKTINLTVLKKLKNLNLFYKIYLFNRISLTILYHLTNDSSNHYARFIITNAQT